MQEQDGSAQSCESAEQGSKAEETRGRHQGQHDGFTKIAAKLRPLAHRYRFQRAALLDEERDESERNDIGNWGMLCLSHNSRQMRDRTQGMIALLMLVTLVKGLVHFAARREKQRCS